MGDPNNDNPQDWIRDIDTQLLDPSFYDFNFSPTTLDALCQLFPEDGQSREYNPELNQHTQTTVSHLNILSNVQEQKPIEQAQLSQLKAFLDEQTQKIAAQQQRISQLESTVESMTSKLESVLRYLKDELPVWNREVTEALRILNVPPMSATRSEFELEIKDDKLLEVGTRSAS